MTHCMPLCFERLSDSNYFRCEIPAIPESRAIWQFWILGPLNSPQGLLAANLMEAFLGNKVRGFGKEFKPFYPGWFRIDKKLVNGTVQEGVFSRLEAALPDRHANIVKDILTAPEANVEFRNAKPDGATDWTPLFRLERVFPDSLYFVQWYGFYYGPKIAVASDQETGVAQTHPRDNDEKPAWERVFQPEQVAEVRATLENIQAAKTQWCFETGASMDAVPAWTDLSPYLTLVKLPMQESDLPMPGGGTYMIGPVRSTATYALELPEGAKSPGTQGGDNGAD